VADAKAWFTRRELADFLTSNGESSRGNMSELAKRVSEVTAAKKHTLKRATAPDENLENTQPNKKMRKAQS
jgi:hypothetical protein